MPKRFLRFLVRFASLCERTLELTRFLHASSELRPWEERELPTAEFLRGEHPRAYLFLHGKQLPRALREDLGKRPRCCRHLGCILPKVPAVSLLAGRRAGAAQRALPQARGAQRLVRLRGRHHPDPLVRTATAGLGRWPWLWL